MTDQQHESGEGAEAPVVRDRRRIDPETGERREPNPTSASAAGPAQAGAASAASDANPQEENESVAAASDELAAARAEAQERLDDLKRLQAEYVNYRRRVERDREAVRESAKAEVLSGFLGVLDDIGRAREHGDLTGAFRAVGEALEAAVIKAGLEQYGEIGDEFDPTIHEALMHGYSDDVQVTTCTQILQPGYRVGDRIVRPARVAVADPTEALPESAEPELVEVPAPEPDEGSTVEAEAEDDENDAQPEAESADDAERTGDN